MTARGDNSVEDKAEAESIVELSRSLEAGGCRWMQVDAGSSKKERQYMKRQYRYKYIHVYIYI